MREIKFRAWDIDSSEMIYTEENRTDFFFDFQDTLKLFLAKEGDFAEDRKAYLMQFYMNLKTYSHDVESFDAYEGDIIQVGRFTPTEYYTVVIEDIRNTYDNLFGSAVVSRKLLGNIYENPELLNPNP